MLTRQARTKIITSLTSIGTCCIIAILFCSNYGDDNSKNNHIIKAAFAASVSEDSQNQLPLQQQQQQSHQPNIKASNIYQTHTIVLGKNIKNLVISIPNEGHEDPAQPKGMRVINQPYS